MEFNLLEKHSEIAILFSPKYSHVVQSIYDRCVEHFPRKNVYLVSSQEILCSAKCDEYESYILAGIECPLHAFSNSIQFKIELPREYRSALEGFAGPKFVDSIYSIQEDAFCGDYLSTSTAADCHADAQSVLCVTESQDVLDYYCHKYENVESPCTGLSKRSRVSFLMKENAGGLKLKNKSMVGVIFTSKAFEKIADSVCARINEHSRAYKIFLKDVSYERLISIDNLDCVVLVDCPVFQWTFSLHIPVITPFGAERAFSNEWKADYDRNCFASSSSRELVIKSRASEIMESRLFRGAVYKNDEEDMSIHAGRKGIASEYENEGK